MLAFLCGALTLCPQLCMGISPRRCTEIGILDPRERDLTEAEEEALDKKEKELTKPIKIRRAISRYQREEALSNPCRSQPVWQDALAGGVFRTSTRLDVESPPPPRVCMSTHPVAEAPPISVRLLVLKDPPGRWPPWRGSRMKCWSAPSSSASSAPGRSLHSSASQLNLSRVYHQKTPYTPKTPQNTPFTRATQPLRAPPIPYKVLKSS